MNYLYNYVNQGIKLVKYCFDEVLLYILIASLGGTRIREMLLAFREDSTSISSPRKKFSKPISVIENRLCNVVLILRMVEAKLLVIKISSM